MYTGIAQAQRTLHVVSTKTLSARCPQTHIVDDTQPCPFTSVIAVIFDVRCTVNNTECLLLVGTLSVFDSADELLVDAI